MVNGTGVTFLTFMKCEPGPIYCRASLERYFPHQKDASKPSERVYLLTLSRAINALRWSDPVLVFYHQIEPSPFNMVLTAFVGVRY